jgi:hypothetical protein
MLGRTQGGSWPALSRATVIKASKLATRSLLSGPAKDPRDARDNPKY